MDFTKQDTVLDLANIREALIRMEETVVFNLIERAQFFQSPSVYIPNALNLPDFDGSFLDWFLREVENTQVSSSCQLTQHTAKIRRFTAPDEVPFFPDNLPEPILPPIKYAKVLAKYHKEINVNDKIKELYIKKVVPMVAAAPGEQEENWGSCATCDIDTLQALSRRIHFGKFVAESKFQSDPETFIKLIKARDAQGIDKAITNEAVEKKVLERLRLKAETYGKDPTLKWSQRAQSTIDVDNVVNIYKDIVIPLTKVVEVDYLLRRLEDWQE